jgi:acetolactate decarboxylase
MTVLSRRAVLKASIGTCTCATCAAMAGLWPAGAIEPATVKRPGYKLRFVGAQRDTIVDGKTGALIDLRVLAATAHLYAIGPIEELRGEITVIDSKPSLARVAPNGGVHVAENFDTGASYLVWAEVPRWQTVSIPPEVQSFAQLEAFVPQAAAAINLPADAPLPFLVRGRDEIIDFHVLNRMGNEPHNSEKHKQIQVSFELKRVEAIIVGFHSRSHRGIFTGMDTNIHIHFQTPDNGISGHIHSLEVGPGAVLSLPQNV